MEWDALDTDGQDAGALKPKRREGPGSDVTRELTGFDARVSDAETGDAGNGASPWGADFEMLDRQRVGAAGIDDDETTLEDDPGSPADLRLNQVVSNDGDTDDEDATEEQSRQANAWDGANDEPLIP